MQLPIAERGGNAVTNAAQVNGSVPQRRLNIAQMILRALRASRDRGTLLISRRVPLNDSQVPRQLSSAPRPPVWPVFLQECRDDVPPYFKTEPVRSQLHLERNRLVLTCMAEGSWPLEFKWIHNGTELTRFSLEYRVADECLFYGPPPHRSPLTASAALIDVAKVRPRRRRIALRSCDPSLSETVTSPGSGRTGTQLRITQRASHSGPVRHAATYWT
ncbi:hypothetical protein SKAU_G00123200 [Synaphobranchus kaupii]|uniref:Ig-like domain-containing protein n=1 Tax=Synaphobranchus kaupii TaxID=118154 RepID=A0A9Q1FP69_SYNKA|nr:hypothetical protein SKAU_G00123200 [Synaphobranchus kaupii]